MGDQPLTISQFIDKATDELLIGPDWQLNMELCSTVNANPSSAAEVVKTIKKRIKAEKKPQTQVLALTLLETLVKNCYATHDVVAHKDFQNSMIKLAEKKKQNSEVKEKLLDMIQVFAKSFVNTQYRSAFENSYIALRRKGIDFPTAEASTPLFEPPTRTSSMPPKRSSIVSSPARSSQQEQDNSVLPRNPKELYEMMKQEVSLVNEILDSIEDASNLKELDALTEMMNHCKEAQPKIIKMLENAEVTNEALVGKMLQLNDDLLRAIKSYDLLAKGENKPKVGLESSGNYLKSSQNDVYNALPTPPTNVNRNNVPNFFSDDINTPSNNKPNTSVTDLFDDFDPRASNTVTSSSSKDTHIPVLSAPPPAVRKTQKGKRLSSQLEGLSLTDNKPITGTSDMDDFFNIATRGNPTQSQQQSQPTNPMYSSTTSNQLYPNIFGTSANGNMNAFTPQNPFYTNQQNVQPNMYNNQTAPSYPQTLYPSAPPIYPQQQQHPFQQQYPYQPQQQQQQSNKQQANKPSLDDIFL